MGEIRNKISDFAKSKLGFVYKELYAFRDWWRVKRQSIFPYHFNKNRYPNFFTTNDYEPFSDVTSKVDRVIYCFWTGDNEMSENRRKGYESLAQNSGVEVRLITPQNLQNYILPEHPLHPAYDNLSLVHKSDYLRCYFMHFYGGGYSDIKTNRNNWEKAFESLESNPEKWLLGYTELTPFGMGKDQGIIDQDLQYYYKSCVGTGGFICRSNTKFTAEWYAELYKRMDNFQEELRKFPGDVKGRNPGYPIGLLVILSQIFAPLCLKYKERIIHNDVTLPVLTNYQ
ncbi:capsular polysaccharide synthesis protein [Epilithonimonas xixisoli]|uniref:Capsular polysaccharide synthesis protein n=1 Tax=Epilithonimonas xixisoli TaxID=1476462 RepID=A0A4R8IG40_9FLAO|nr:capsular polysaccharide synthesis protein [Epilithonimonas xixisoli]TDX84730.1 capsular polysaccharide synthesis protein [Epilithonimonas xixisoli]